MQQPTIGQPRSRIQSIDLLRGLVMIIMALDHSRDFFHAHSVNGNDPLDFHSTSPILFFTRWITNYCAPVFVFLAGTSIYFMSLKRTKKELSLFLLTRGLWLMVMELTFVNIAWEFRLTFEIINLGVIWVIGLSMVCLSALILIPFSAVLTFCLVVVFAHNLFDSSPVRLNNDAGGFIHSILHVFNVFKISDTHYIFLIYPLIPWFAVMGLGFCLGKIYRSEVGVETRKKTLVFLGLGCLLLFGILRAGNFYGDPIPWEKQATGVFTFFSFLNVWKYPPSLLFLLITIGPAMIILAFAETWKGKIVNFIVIYGKVPFFYYILHLFLIHTIARILFYASGHHTSELYKNFYFGGLPKGYGVDLFQTYLLWILVVGLLYFPCRWYSKFKSSHSYWWLSYI